jgi:hypothetical protein
MLEDVKPIPPHSSDLSIRFRDMVKWAVLEFCFQMKARIARLSLARVVLEISSTGYIEQAGRQITVKNNRTASFEEGKGLPMVHRLHNWFYQWGIILWRPNKILRYLSPSFFSGEKFDRKLGGKPRKLNKALLRLFTLVAMPSSFHVCRWWDFQDLAINATSSTKNKPRTSTPGAITMPRASVSWYKARFKHSITRINHHRNQKNLRVSGKVQLAARQKSQCENRTSSPAFIGTFSWPRYQLPKSKAWITC